MIIWRAGLVPQGTLHHIIQIPDGFCLEIGAGIRGVFGRDRSAVGCFDLCHLPNSGEKKNALINLGKTARKLVPEDGVQAL
jgi:hypothetical protein